jgi:hypothetical protein
VYTADIPTHPNTLIATFADNTCILTSDPDPNTTSQILQDHLSSIQSWCQRWRVKVNGAKSAHMTFTLRRRPCPAVLFIPFPSPEHVRYLGLHLDCRLTWTPHTRLKRTDLNRIFGLLRPLLSRRSENKSFYKTILLPTVTYAM